MTPLRTPPAAPPPPKRAAPPRRVGVVVLLCCRAGAVPLRRGRAEAGNGYRPIGKNWRTLRRGDLVRGPEGYEYTVKRLTLREAEPPLPAPCEIESVAAWAATGLVR